MWEVRGLSGSMCVGGLGLCDDSGFFFINDGSSTPFDLLCFASNFRCGCGLCGPVWGRRFAVSVRHRLLQLFASENQFHLTESVSSTAHCPVNCTPNKAIRVAFKAKYSRILNRQNKLTTCQKNVGGQTKSLACDASCVP